MSKRMTFSVAVCVLSLAVLAGPVRADEFKTSGFYPNDAVSYFNFDLGYRYDLNSGITKGSNGFFIELGLNLARFFNPATVVSPFIGLNTLGSGEYAGGFQDAVNDHYRTPSGYTALQNRDTSVNPYTENEMRELDAYQIGESRMDVLRTGNPEGSLDLYYGLILRYPHRYAPIIKIYSTWSSTDMGSVSSGLVEVYSGAAVKTARLLDRFGWGVEVIVFRGYTVIGAEGLGNLNVGYVSLFYETLNLKDARIYHREYDADPGRDVYLREYEDDSFFDHWGTETKIGIKLGAHFF